MQSDSERLEPLSPYLRRPLRSIKEVLAERRALLGLTEIKTGRDEPSEDPA